MDFATEMRAMTMLLQLQENEVMSRALREMNIRKQPWYKRPLYRFRIARGFRKAWKARMAENYRRLAELNAKQAEKPVTPDFGIDISPNAN